jgi:hypothetical protein
MKPLGAGEARAVFFISREAAKNAKGEVMTIPVGVVKGKIYLWKNRFTRINFG